MIEKQACWDSDEGAHTRFLSVFSNAWSVDHKDFCHHNEKPGNSVSYRYPGRLTDLAPIAGRHAGKHSVSLDCHVYGLDHGMRQAKGDSKKIEWMSLAHCLSFAGFQWYDARVVSLAYGTVKFIPHYVARSASFNNLNGDPKDFYHAYHVECKYPWLADDDSQRCDVQVWHIN